MLFFQHIDADVHLTRNDPLFVGHFFSLERMRWATRKKKQRMIFSVAFAWYKLVKRQLKTPGMIDEELILTALTKEVRDAKVIVRKFFDIVRIGFNLGDGVNHSPTMVRPKRLSKDYINSIERLLNKVTFNPGEPPTSKHLVKTRVRVLKQNAAIVRHRLKQEEREDLQPAVEWLYEQEGDITFYYRPAGKLQARETSVWPVRAIEQWPGWLRAELFGLSVDLENAFVQFMLFHLEKKYASNPEALKLKYPDLLRAAYDKANFRAELCRDVLHRQVNDENISIVKKLIMALANGSNVSPKLMLAETRIPEAVALIRPSVDGLPPTMLLEIGKRLQSIAKQFRRAKRELCITLFNAKPTRENQKKIFTAYFSWERDARKAIWEVVDRTGLMLHDGIDGVITDLDENQLIRLVHERTSLRVSVDVPSAVTDSIGSDPVGRTSELDSRVDHELFVDEQPEGNGSAERWENLEALVHELD